MLTGFPATARRHSSALRTASGLALASLALAACASGPSGPVRLADVAARTAPTPDPRVGLEPGVFDAGEASWNLRRVSSTPPPREFVGGVNSDLAFTGDYVIQGSFSGIQVWDISEPTRPEIVTSYVCPASQSDVSVYGDLLFVSGEGYEGRLDCGTDAPQAPASPERLRGIRIFDISDITSPRYVANVQTCRGSHTHTLVENPNDDDNVYIYVSGSAPVRPAEELAGCSGALPEEDPNTALFRIEVIRVPLDAPEQAQIVSSPRLFAGLVAPPEHGLSPVDLAEIEEARARGAFVLDVPDAPEVLPDQTADQLLAAIVQSRGGSGAPTAADSTTLRDYLTQLVEQEIIPQLEAQEAQASYGPTQCHDITAFPELGLAGGACEGYGLLIDISDPTSPRRIAEASDENFSYWHSATFSNEGTKVLFTDEWGGGTQPKCRAGDPAEWGADAIFTIEGGELVFQGYHKLSAPQTPEENCVAHNGSPIPIPGRDVMVQAWYQGGISVFDWTDPADVVEIAFHDRGPVDGENAQFGGSWSVYWYNGVLVSSEIARGLDVFELVPSPLLSQNEIDAARSVTLEHLNAQTQPPFVWPPSFSLAGAYLDQLERSAGLDEERIAAARETLASADGAQDAARREALEGLAADLEADAGCAPDAAKVRTLVEAVRELAASGG